MFFINLSPRVQSGTLGDRSVMQQTIHTNPHGFFTHYEAIRSQMMIVSLFGKTLVLATTCFQMVLPWIQMNHLRRYFRDSREGDVGLPLCAQSSGHSQTDVRAGLWNVQSLLSSLLILRSGRCCASPRALSSSVSSVQLALNYRPHKDHTNMLRTNSHLQRLVLVYLFFPS